ncbi:MAG: zf-HC2 domain-containing protein [Candidatus Hydrogenedentes bacterium]|nr:zf-HC2 domain-containing protein [Candidatus Hydrogenedentota bacterium]
MECRLIRSRLTTLVDGDARPAERAVIEAHLRECPDCADEAAAVRDFLDTCDDLMVCPGVPYSFEFLKTRLEHIEPLQEIIAFLPKLRVRGTVPRYVVTALMLMLVIGTQYTWKGGRHVYTAMKTPFTLRSVEVEAAAEGVLQCDPAFDTYRQAARQDRGTMV